MTLGLLTFNTLNAGTSAFTFTYGDLQGLEGIDPLDDSVENGSVPVVPVPPIALLLGIRLERMRCLKVHQVVGPGRYAVLRDPEGLPIVLVDVLRQLLRG